MDVKIMDVTVDRFPDEAVAIYKKQRMQRMDSDIQAERKLSQDKVEHIRNSLRFPKRPEEGSMLVICLCLGFVCGFAVCLPMNSIGAALSSFLITLFSFEMAGCIMDELRLERYEKSVENLKESSTKEIQAEKARCEALIQQMRNSAEADCTQYRVRYQNRFDTQVQSQVLKLSDSETVRSIADWMTPGFSRMIDAADRSNYIEQIKVPYSFKVYPNRIESPAGVFDFMKERKQTLNGPIEQTALAIALASAIQTNIVMKYPQDTSGTNAVVDVSPYNSEYGSAMVRMTYSAPNGNFVNVQGWWKEEKQDIVLTVNYLPFQKGIAQWMFYSALTRMYPNN